MPAERPSFGDTFGQSPDVHSRSAQDKVGRSEPAVFGSAQSEPTNPIRAAARRRTPFLGVDRTIIGKCKFIGRLRR